jgi:hypothetical protein
MDIETEKNMEKEVEEMLINYNFKHFIKRYDIRKGMKLKNKNGIKCTVWGIDYDKKLISLEIPISKNSNLCYCDDFKIDKLFKEFIFFDNSFNPDFSE